jgi:hypothetical protein
MIRLNDCNGSKIDLFNIGLVLLSTVMLRDCYYLYDRALLELNQEKLANLLEEMKHIHTGKTYSSNLLNYIQEFLILDSDKRKTPQYFFQLLNPYEREIENLEPFLMKPDCGTEKMGVDKMKTLDETPILDGIGVIQPLSFQSAKSTNSPERKYLKLARHLSNTP